MVPEGRGTEQRGAARGRMLEQQGRVATGFSKEQGRREKKSVRKRPGAGLALTARSPCSVDHKPFHRLQHS